MGSVNFFKSIISSKKKGKDDSPKKPKDISSPVKSKGFRWKSSPHKIVAKSANGIGNRGTLDMPIEDIAATRIQTAFRAYKARKSLRRLKGVGRLHMYTQKNQVKKQATTILTYLNKWSAIQSEIRDRRLSMVTEGRRKQKKYENQQKLEAKLHDFEVEWSGGPSTKEEILARIHHREEAAVKRERAMAYAFSHQWRANSNHPWLSSYELGKSSWVWSWKEHWIAVCPWEIRIPQFSSPKKLQTKQVDKNSNLSSVKVKTLNRKATKTAVRRLSYPGAEKPTPRERAVKADQVNDRKQEVVLSVEPKVLLEGVSS